MTSKARQAPQRPAPHAEFQKQHSWKTTDEYEIALRRNRAETEELAIAPKPSLAEPFRDYQVQGLSGQYTVEMRDLDKCLNSCDCPDFQKNGLGTCKHIEAVRARLANAAVRFSPNVEIYCRASDGAVMLACPDGTPSLLRKLLADFFTPKESSLREASSLKRLLQLVENLPASLRDHVRVSRAVRARLAHQEQCEQLEALRQAYEKRFKDGGLPRCLKCRLFDYQIDGMLFLAFHGRAILADEMGLGKTVQAVAAASVMKEVLNISRVLVVCPASLKLEWQEQIEKFTYEGSQSVFGGRSERLKTYRTCSSFFLLTNYEQVMRDYRELQELYRPELIILDEAQRIKNWNTKTARCLKMLSSPYVYVLTGTPLENRIDDLYSLVEIIDPTIFGSLFRFNRNFYRFDAEGKIAGLQNLERLHNLLGPIMLRRRKDEVEDDLPPRSDRNFFVKLTGEQWQRYHEYEDLVARLVHLAGKRPLRPEEFERLQRHLACMRMLCDSCYILDDEIRESPKVEEFMELYHSLQKDTPGRKLIVFSEWTRMLDLVTERLDREGIGYALHIGSVPQQRRREEIARFKNDPACQVFLSSDSGGVGLNLQVASVVVNLDLPWNPAKLNQRIARAWRKFQKNSVLVFNLVSEDTIEHRMLGTLSYKSGLSDVVLDARGDAETFQNADARQAFVKKLAELMAAPAAATPPPIPPAESLRRNNPGVQRLYAVKRADGKEAYLCIGSAAPDVCARLLRCDQVTCLSPEIYAELLKLRDLGIVTVVPETLKLLFEATEEEARPAPVEDPLRKKRQALAENDCREAERKIKMAALLHNGDFQAEALQAVQQAADLLALAVHRLVEDPEAPLAQLSGDDLAQILADGRLDDETRLFLRCATGQTPGPDKWLIEHAPAALQAVRALAVR